MGDAAIGDPDGGDEASEVLLEVGKVTIVEGGDCRFEDGIGEVFAHGGSGGVVGRGEGGEGGDDGAKHLGYYQDGAGVGCGEDVSGEEEERFQDGGLGEDEGAEGWGRALAKRLLIL